MTSISRSSEKRPRSLAVYQTPSVPEGWHGRDLVRIVDPVGLAMAWISPRHAGAIVSFETRLSTESPWITRHRAGADPDTALTLLENSVPIWKARSGWVLQRRDPTSATIVNDDGSIEILETCELGELRVTVSASQGVRSVIDPGAFDPDQISILVDRTDTTLEIRLVDAEEDAEAR